MSTETPTHDDATLAESAAQDDDGPCPHGDEECPGPDAVGETDELEACFKCFASVDRQRGTDTTFEETSA